MFRRCENSHQSRLIYIVGVLFLLLIAGLAGMAQAQSQEHLFRAPETSNSSRSPALADAGDVGSDERYSNPFRLPVGVSITDQAKNSGAQTEANRLQPIKKGSLPVLGQPTGIVRPSSRDASVPRSGDDGVSYDDLLPPALGDGVLGNWDSEQFQDEMEEITPRTRQLPIPDDFNIDNQFDSDEAEDYSREVVIQRFADGMPQIERQVIQDEQGNYVNDGFWRVYSPTGEKNLIAEGRYRRGMMHGIWKRIHARDSSPLFQTTPFSLFEGPFISIAMFQDNRLEGMWVIMDEGERKIFEMPYRKGTRHGTASWFYPSLNKMRETTFKDGLIHGQLREWDEQQRLTRDEEFVNGRRVVRNVTYYRPQQAESESFYLDGQLQVDGEDDWWKAQPARLTTAGEKLQHGPANLWYDNGLPKMKGQYADGLRVGKFVWWHPNGTKQSEGAYVKGRKEGLWSWWHANGMKASEGNFENDLALGDWTWWDENGKVERRQTFSEATGDEMSADSNLPEDADRLNDLLDPMFQQPIPGRGEELKQEDSRDPIGIDDLEDILPIRPGSNQPPNGSIPPRPNRQESEGSVKASDPFRVPLNLFDD